MDVNDTYDYSDELNEGGKRRIRGGCTIGRIINLCMALDFLLVMVTALIVSGTLGAVNLNVGPLYVCGNVSVGASDILVNSCIV